MSNEAEHGHEDKKVKSPGLPPLSQWVIVITVLILLIFGAKTLIHKNKEGSSGNGSEKKEAGIVKNQYTEVYVLKNNEAETHPIPIGYKPEFSGGGKMYYLRIDDKPEVLLPQSNTIDFGDYNQEFTIRKHESEKVVKIMVTYIPF